MKDVDLSREFGTKELREDKVELLARTWDLKVEVFLRIRELVNDAYNCGERNGRMCGLANQTAVGQAQHNPSLNKDYSPGTGGRNETFVLHPAKGGVISVEIIR